MAVSVEELERNIKRLFAEFTYAAIEDIRAGWKSEQLWLVGYYEHYKHFTDDSQKKQKLKSVFTMGSEFVQVQSALFVNFAQNIHDVDPTGADTVETLAEKFESIDDSFGSFICSSSTDSMRSRYGKNLLNASDRKQYLRGKLEIMMQGRPNGVILLMTQVAEMFNAYVREMAFRMAFLAWY